MSRFIERACERWPGLPVSLLDRLAHAHGTRITALLGAARSVSDLGRDFGAGLTEAEVNYLVRHEWARSAEDILWRRTRLGLELGGSAVHDLQDAVAKLLG
jgi:glycerol-3-phosphate dehydrogenase